MHVRQIIICVLIIISGGACAANKFSFSRNPVKISVVFRHGDRLPYLLDTPIEMYKNITLDQPSESLTKAGANRAKKLGAKLRKQYDSFFGTYSPNQMEAFSSPIQRCKDTFTNMSTTLYPLSANGSIPFNSPSLYEDKLIATFVSCEKILNRKDYTINDPGDVELLKKIYQETGQEFYNYRDAIVLQDLLKVMNELGYGMPNWAEDNWDQFMTLYKNFWKTLVTKHGNDAAGNLFYKIARDSANSKRIKNPKVNLYSGHDLNILALLHLLKSFDIVKSVNYCAYIAFEVYKPLIGSYYVEIYFDNDDGKGRRRIQIPGCDYRCSVTEFLEYAEQFYNGHNWCN